MDRGSFDRNSLDQNRHFSVDQKFNNEYDHLIEVFETFQLIEFLG